MRKFLTRRALPLLAALVLCMSLAVPAFAAEQQYTPVGVTTNPSFQKALIVDENANVPSITFQYSVDAGTAQAAGDGTMAVLAGIGSPTIADVVFAPTDAKAATATGVTVDAGEKVAVKTATIDFTGITFPEPGIYRYIVTETSAKQQGIAYDTQAATAGVKTRVLDVYVIDTDGTLSVGNCVFHEGADTDPVAAGEDLGSTGEQEKSQGFVNEYTTYDLTLSKTVAGNQGSQDKYFKFTVAITNAGANVDLDIDMTGAHVAPTKTAATKHEAADMAAANGLDEDANVAGQQWKTDADGAVTKTLYLQHGDTIVIKGLAKGANMTVTEDAEDYKSNHADGVTISNMAADGEAAFTNTRAGTVPTGIMMSIGSGAAVVALGAAGIAFGVAKKNKKEDEE